VKPSWRPWRNLLVALVGISLFQLATSGSVTWPATVAGKIGSTLGEYANRPGASWRKAATELEELGAAREGQPIPEFGITGRVVRVADGDTVSVLDSHNTQYKVRLHGIDTPERDQRYGRTARDALSGMVAGRNVGVVVLGKDSYGRTDGTVYLGERNINLAMVAAGHAWWYRYYAPDEHLLEAAEDKARAERLGLWAEPNPVPPWEWRRQQKYGKP
jgi:endonuclease YncB( thermonuclease family)